MSAAAFGKFCAPVASRRFAPHLPSRYPSSSPLSRYPCQSRSSLAEFAQTQHELRLKLDVLAKDNTRLQREVGSARAEAERLKLEIVAANTKPESATDNVMVSPSRHRLPSARGRLDMALCPPSAWRA